MTTTIDTSAATVTLRADEEFAAERWFDAARSAMRRCTCGKRRGQGHALHCARVFGGER